MKNWKAIIGVIAIFILGGLAGSITTIGLVRHRLVHGHGSQMLQDLIIRRLSWDLRLDRAQRAQLRVIVAQGHEDMKVIRKQIQPQVEELLTRYETKVRAILRPDQQEKFDKLIAERKARWVESSGG
jgi:hypothetical protein